MNQNIEAAVAAFDLGGRILAIEENYGEGHINRTHLITVQQADGTTKDYVLQRINTEAFNKPVEVMENVMGVTRYLADRIAKEGGDPWRETLRFYRARDGKPYYVDEDHGFWRISDYVTNIVTYQQAQTAGDFARSGRAFARFIDRLDDYPVDTLHETIPNFHDTRKRYVNFKRARTIDKVRRAEGVQEEIRFVRARKQECGILVDMMHAGELPRRVTHNDTKLNNVLFDKVTGDGICVIDLDTVMPGLVAFDYGDAIRFGASTALEDEKDLSKVNFSLEYYEAYTHAYLEELGETLTPSELLTLPWGAKLMTYECGMRFLTDYLDGDIYFGTAYPEHNLVRARTQFELVRQMEANWDAMFHVIFEYLEKES